MMVTLLIASLAVVLRVTRQARAEKNAVNSPRMHNDKRIT